MILTMCLNEMAIRTMLYLDWSILLEEQTHTTNYKCWNLIKEKTTSYSELGVEWEQQLAAINSR